MFPPISGSPFYFPPPAAINGRSCRWGSGKKIISTLKVLSNAIVERSRKSRKRRKIKKALEEEI